MKLNDIFEASPPVQGSRVPGLDYEEKLVSKKSGIIDRVILRLKGNDSGSMTRIGKIYEKLDKQEKQMKLKRDRMNAIVKKKMERFFDAEDVWYTRVIETVSVVMTLAKRSEGTAAVPPKEVTNIDYQQVTMELLAMLEGDLLRKGAAILLKYTEFETIPGIPAQEPKSPALTVKVKNNESINEAFNWTALTHWADKYLAYFQTWGAKFDAKLNNIKAQLNMSESVKESDGHKPMSAMPTEELKQIWRDCKCKDHTCSQCLAVKHNLLHRRVHQKESKVNEASNDVVLAKLKVCKFAAEKIHNAIAAIEEHIDTAKVKSGEVDDLYDALDDVKELVLKFSIYK